MTRPNQLSAKRQAAEQAYVRKLEAEASRPITDYAVATFFQLKHHAAQGDEQAAREMARRQS